MGQSDYIYFTILPQDTHKFYIKNSSGNPVAWFGIDFGNLVLKGTLTQNTTITPIANDEFRFRANGNDVMLIDQTNGNMYIKGFLYENQNNLNPTQQSDDFIIRNSTKNVVAYVNESGYVF